MKVENIMTSTVFCVGSGQSLNEASQLMWEHNCGSLPVVDEDNQIVGMLTDRDIAMAAYINGKTLSEIPVSTAHSQELVCCQKGDDISDVQHMMQGHQVHRIPVIGDRGEPLGIVSLNDIARAYKAGTRQIKAKDISDTLAAICGPSKVAGTPTAVAAA